MRVGGSGLRFGMRQRRGVFGLEGSLPRKASTGSTQYALLGSLARVRPAEFDSTLTDCCAAGGGTG